MTRLTSITAAAIVAAMSIPYGATSAHADTLLQVVIDHSGVLHDEQDPQGKSGFNQFVSEFLHDLARAHRRDRDDTRVVLISGVAPSRIIWSGDAASFYREGIRSPELQTVLEGQPNGCNDLPEALSEVSANFRLAPADETVLHVITSGVHSGPDCADLTQEGYINLVETADPALAEALQAAAAQIGQVYVHFLTATQRRALLDAIDVQSTGITLRAQGQTTGF
ncbi:hypothetical protein KBY31_21295 [Ruegeria pomeroyi]|nr:hypothetical protein [Ruegeria pomeroyi]